MKGLFNRIIRSGRYRLFIRPFSPLVRVLKRSLDKDFKPKIIVKVDGGLGSQMWQYALGRAAGKASGLPVFYDMSWFDTGGLDINGVYSRAYQLENVFPVLNISPPPRGRFI
ncbi:hypothetical protein FACS1894216_19680 [Synergistales bacterium]|nr:hypothetical protein FACS1894216_19680 [Synergistales bacterium]